MWFVTQLDFDSILFHKPKNAIHDILPVEDTVISSPGLLANDKSTDVI